MAQSFSLCAIFVLYKYSFMNLLGQLVCRCRDF